MMFLHLSPFLAFAYFMWRRLRRYLHIFQQEGYDAPRFLKWVIATAAFDRKLSLALIAYCIAAPLAQFTPAHVDVLLAFIFAGFGWWESDPRKIAKKKLDMTQRATRIFYVAFALCLVMGGAMHMVGGVLPWMLAVQFAPLSIALANLILTPFETSIQRRIMREASAKLAQIAPDVIGITGSFGKTSVKHILGHILEMNAPTLYTPGSVNTLMGISRIINEKLYRGCRFFIVEMGAYGVGSIRKLCSLTPPSMGVITSLGEAHYERFKSLDAVARAKFELANSVLEHKNGRLVVHESVLEQDYARDYVARNRARFIICGQGAECDLQIGRAEQSAEGLTVPVRRQGEQYDLFAPLYGMAHAGNIAVAFAACIALDIVPSRAVAALRTVPQIRHRLEVKPQQDGLTYIDDAFNSNPKGFAAALDVLNIVGKARGGKRILITPGMLELGDKHDDAHYILGDHAADVTDVALVIRADRIPTFIAGFRSRNKDKILIEVENLAEAQKWLRDNGRPNDVYLIENDLPDNSEARLVL